MTLTATGPATWIAVDWGTTSFRAWAMDAMGHPLAEVRAHEGMQHCAASPQGFAPVLQAHRQALGRATPLADDLPVLICGMAGARQGWIEAPYLAAPTHLQALHEGAVRVPTAGDVRILPGVAQRLADRPDVMRGEETKLAGLAEAGHSGLVCMPGTHSKWVQLDGGELRGFDTCMTGELFALLSRQSILRHAMPAAPAAAADGASTVSIAAVAAAGAAGAAVGAADALPVFRQAVADVLAAPARFSAQLFGVRAAQLLGFAQGDDGAERLSGLVIGLEVAQAVQRHGTQPGVMLVGAGAVGQRYHAALSLAGYRVQDVDADAAVQRGLARCAARLWPQRVQAHASR